MIESKDNLSPDQSFVPPPPPWRQNAYNRPAVPTPPMPPMGGNFSGGSLPGVGDLLSQSWQILTARIGTFLIITAIPFIALIVMIAASFISLSAKSDLKQIGSLPEIGSALLLNIVSLGLILVLWLAFLLLNFWAQIALIRVVAKREERIGVKEAYFYAIRKTFSYLWVIILSGIIITGGMFLFFIPGVVFAVWFSLAAFVLVNEDARGMAAILKSKEYMRGQWFAIFWRWLALGLIAWLISIPAGIAISVAPSIIKLIAGAVLGSTAGQYAGVMIGLIFLIPLQAITVSFGIIYGSLIYAHLRLLRGSFEFNPSGGQKIGFLAIGIFGIIFPLLMFGYAIMNILTSFGAIKSYKSDLKYNVNASFNGAFNNQNLNRSFQNANNKQTNTSNINMWNDVLDDTDRDGLADPHEKIYKTNPNLSDTDFDGLLDSDEVNTWKTNPINPDTDGDGFRDGDEVKNGYNPLGGGKTQ